MSSLDPIEVIKDISPAGWTELMRLNELDVKELMAHRRTMEMSPCDTCRGIRKAMEVVAAGGTTPMLRMVEEIGPRLAERSMIPGMWGHMSEEGRNAVRAQAAELILIINPDLSLQLDPKES
jgi:hypothetical protein